MNAEAGLWSRLTKVILFLLLLATLLGVVVSYLPLIRHNERMRQEDLRLNGEIRKEEEIARQMKASINTLQHDPKTIERLAREKLGYARTNETVIRFEPPITNSPPAPPRL